MCKVFLAPHFLTVEVQDIELAVRRAGSKHAVVEPGGGIRQKTQGPTHITVQLHLKSHEICSFQRGNRYKLRNTNEPGRQATEDLNNVLKICITES